MGALVVCVPPIAGTLYDKWNVYRSTTKDGSYSKITATPQLLTDLTYYDKDGTSTSWYRITYYDSSTPAESGYSDPQQVISETYTSSSKVAGFMGVAEFTDSTTPTLDKVIFLINAAEDFVDTTTHHAWRTKTVTEETYDIDNKPYMYGTGRAIYLMHRKVKTFSTSLGDKIEIWNGSSWEDWGVTHTEGRGSDWWIDYQFGVLYLRLPFAPYIEKSIRLTYRYGEDTVPWDIQLAATKFVARELLYSEDRTFLLPEGSSQITWGEKLREWERDINRIMNNHVEWSIVGR